LKITFFPAHDLGVNSPESISYVGLVAIATVGDLTYPWVWL